MPTSLNKGRPVVLDEPNSEVAQAVRQLAVRFAGQALSVARPARSRTPRPRRSGRLGATRDQRRGTRCPWQTGWRRPSRRTGSPRSAFGCRSAWSRASVRACTTRPSPTPSPKGMVHQRLRELLDEEVEGPLAAQEKLLIVRRDRRQRPGPRSARAATSVTRRSRRSWSTTGTRSTWSVPASCSGPARSSTTRVSPPHGSSMIVAKVGRRVDERGRWWTRVSPTAPVERDHPAASIDGPSSRSGSRRPVPGRRPGGVRDDELVRVEVPRGASAWINIMVAATKAGKTTTLNVISSFTPDDERIVTIEDAAELAAAAARRAPGVAPAQHRGQGQVTIRDLVRNSCVCVRPHRRRRGPWRRGWTCSRR